MAYFKGISIHRGITYWELKAGLGAPALVTATDEYMLVVYVGNWGRHYFAFRRGLLDEHFFLGGY